MLTPWEGVARPPRRWQVEALDAARKAMGRGKTGVVSACTGAGKSVLIAELTRQARVHEDLVVVICTPTQALVEQLADTVRARIGYCGRFYGKAKDIQPVVVTCFPSAANLAVEIASRGQKVGLCIVDECHGSESDMLIEALPLLSARWRIGVTATAYRSNTKETLSIWDDLIYRYGYADALRDGVLVDFHPVTYNGEGTNDLNTVCLNMIKTHGHGPGVTNAKDIADAEEHATWLQGNGVNALAIHSKLHISVQRQRIAALEHGNIQCLVHVAMLTEGVDFPWLRWLCFRRPVGSRVRVVQELGRGLRSYPGKDSCKVLDPHNLLRTVGIAHPEALGPILDDPEPGVPRVILNPTQREAAELPNATAVDEVTRWAQGLHLALQAEGLIESKAAIAQWRDEPSTDKQIKALSSMKWALRFLPECHRDAAKAAMQNPWGLTRGAASDLLDVLFAMAEATKADREHARSTGNWRRKIVGWPAGLDVEPLSGVAVLRLSLPA